ncbi:MAG: TonB-dependent receptor [Bacteroidota bacterium]
MRFFTSAVIFSVVFIQAQAQFSLTGTVRDVSTQEPVTGATVYIADLKKGAVTDLDGKYVIENIPRGKFLVEYIFVGYGTVVQSIDMRSSQELNVTLSSTVTELNEIVISGISHSTELKKNPVPITTLGRDALVQSTSSNIIDNIAQKPGIDKISTGAAIAKPVIRGLSYNRIITLFDGTRQEGQQWGDEHGIEIDEFSVDRVEVIKGAGSLMYGSDGLGGVINFLTPNPETVGTIKSHWISNYQSNHGLFANSIMNAGNLNGYYWSARASRKDARPYQNAYDGRVFNSGFREKDFSVLLGVNKSWGYSQFLVSSFQQTLGLVEGERDENGDFMFIKNINGTEQEATANMEELKSYSLFFPQQNIRHKRISNATNFYAGDTRVQVNLGYQRNQRREYGNVLEPNEPDLFFDLTTATGNVIVFFPEASGWNLSATVSSMWQQNENRGNEFLVPQYRLWDWGAAAFARKNFDRLDLSGGLRFDSRQLSIEALYLDDEGMPTSDSGMTQKFKSDEPSFANISASAGTTYQFSQTITAKANISRGFRAPNISELASNGRHEGSLRYEYGSYALKPENSWQFDISTLVNTDHLSAEVSVFQNNINHYIFVEKLLSSTGTDSIPDPSDPVPAYQYTQGRAQLTGGEVFFDLHPHPLDWLHFENSFSTVYAVNKSQSADSAKYLPFIPAPRWQSELRATAKQWKSFSNLFVRLQFQHHVKQDRVLLENATETPTPSYSLWHAGCGFDVVNKNKRTIFSFLFTAANLFDKAYQHHLSRLKYASEHPITGRQGVYNMGRNFSFKIQVPVVFRTGK